MQPQVHYFSKYKAKNENGPQRIYFSKHIEDRVNQMVRDRDQKGEAGHVYIRVVFIGDKHFETRSGVRKQANELYGANSNQIIEKYKYRAKGLSLKSLLCLLIISF